MSLLNTTSLTENGLNLLAVLDTITLPKAITKTLTNVPLEKYKRLVLIGNAGGEKLWAAMQKRDMSASDPIDNFSIEMAKAWISEQLHDAPHHILYPLTNYLVPLQQLGVLAGWHHNSPLGLGIHSQYGVWFAYRVAFLVDAELPLQTESPTPSPCDSCIDKPCISRCPVGAVEEIGRFQISTCGKHRIAPNSSCADRCLSRLACPIGREYRYPLAQIQYHYAHALPTMRAWYERSLDDETN